MFINLTNHPSDTWSADQLAAAELFGRVIDMSFPIVSPDATTDEIHQLADQLVADVLLTAEAAQATAIVHVMGEHTLTYALVVRLKEKGNKCVASTSERNTIMLPDGKKVSEFKFTQFREY